MIVCVWGDKCHLYLIMIIRQHLLMSGDLELNPGPLGELDLRNVTNELGSMIAKWFAIGIQLGIGRDKLLQIETDYRTADRCFSEVINFWLDGNTQVIVTWKSLVEVLESAFVNEKGLARRLREKGELLEPVEGPVAPSDSASDSTEFSENADTLRAGMTSTMDASPEPSIFSGDAVSEVDMQPDQESFGVVVKPNFTFSFLDLTKLSKEEKQQLHQQLYTESIDMTRKFQSLFSATTESLKRQKVSIRSLVCHLVGLGPFLPTYEDLELPPFRHQLPELRKAKNIDDAMVVIGDYCSFFNYHMIEHIINKLGTRQDKKNLTKYKQEFTTYAERHVFKCPSEVGTLSNGLMNMIVTLDQTFESCTVRNLELFIHDLRKIFNISTNVALKLCRITPGSLKLTFQLHTSLFHDIFPLSDEQKLSLADLAVTKLLCGVYVYRFTLQNSKRKERSNTTDDTCTAADAELVTCQRVKEQDNISVADSGIGSSVITHAMVDHTALGDEPYLRRKSKLQLPDDRNELHQASLRRELDEVKHLVEKKDFNPLQTDEVRNNALHYAAAGGDWSIVKYFIEERALNPACLGYKGLTPLHMAAIFKHIKVIQYLVDKHNDRVNSLILCLDEDGCTPLHRACGGGDINIIKYLINAMKKHTSESGEEVIYMRTKDRNTAVHIAALEGHLPVVKLFIAEFNFYPNTPGYRGRSPLVCAAQEGHLSIVKYLTEEVACDPSHGSGKDKVTPLHLAAKYGHMAIIQYLTLGRRCNPLIQDCRGNTPLHNAALNGQYEAVNFFISELACDPNIPGWRGRTPLHNAAQEGHFNVIKFLIRVKRCNPMCLDIQNSTPLDLAVTRGHLLIVKYLIDRDPLSYDRALGIPLHWATYCGQLEMFKHQSL